MAKFVVGQCAEVRKHAELMNFVSILLKVSYNSDMYQLILITFVSPSNNDYSMICDIVMNRSTLCIFLILKF